MALAKAGRTRRKRLRKRAGPMLFIGLVHAFF